MSTLYVEEYGSAATGTDGDKVSAPKDFISNTTVTVSGTSARTSFDFGSACRMVILFAAADMYVNFGDSSVTATSSDRFMPGGTFRSFGIDALHSRVAAILK